jgi:hypothetical protein
VRSRQAIASSVAGIRGGGQATEPSSVVEQITRSDRDPWQRLGQQRSGLFGPAERAVHYAREAAADEAGTQRTDL